MKTKTYTEEDVVTHLRDYGRRLMLMHVGDGKAWFVPGLGRITDDVAHAVLARLDIHGIHDDQWPGISQVYAYRWVA
jgi:hypothetical protein